MLSIRFKPVGKKKQISFRVVVVERRSKLQGRFIEDLGWCNPHTDTHNVKEDRVKYWIGVGAQPTDSVHNMLVRASVVTGPKRAVHAKKKVSKEEEKQGEEAKKEAPISSESQTESTKEDVESQSVEKEEEKEKTEEVKDESESSPQESVEEEDKQEKTQEGKKEENDKNK